LDSVVAHHAQAFTTTLPSVVERARTEEDIRIATERLLALVGQDAGIALDGQHEFTLAKGRVDSVYQRVLIEYKNPQSTADRIGPNLTSAGTRKVVTQIQSRFTAVEAQLGHQLTSLFGVGFDGRRFVFVRYFESQWRVEPPVDVTEATASRFLWALFNLGLKGKAFTPDGLALDFGANSSLARTGIRTLYTAIRAAAHPRAQMFFKQWRILFSEVCGYDVDAPGEKLRELATHYGVGARARPAELLFAVHTYYALFMKLLASEVVAFFHTLPRPVQRLTQASTAARLRTELTDVEAGGIFRHLGITNFLEGDLFAWYLSAWSADVADVIRSLAMRLDDYNPGTLSDDPIGSRDLLKQLYQHLFPRTLRRDLGEYYTPDWLADHVLNDLAYDGNPDVRLLDPACGSGTFLVLAIGRARSWYEKNRERTSLTEAEFCRRILTNIVGFDLNPLAVMAARTNYLIALRTLLNSVDRAELPVYLCDAVLTASEYGDLFTGNLGTAQRLDTAAARFLIPTEVGTERSLITRYAEHLEYCVAHGCSSDEFLDRCRDDSLPIASERLHVQLYDQLVALNLAEKNGVWARIIKNAFAPVFLGRVDLVAGNPPWINWENLPPEYRASSERLWQQYGLKASGGRAAIGKSKHELAALFLYACADSYLKTGGRLGFVLTQSLFKNRGGAGFRKLKWNGTHLAPQTITDLTALTVFSGATNRVATMVVRKQGTGVPFPLPYEGWEPLAETTIPEDLALSDVLGRVRRVPMHALPSDPARGDAPWLTCPVEVSSPIQRILGSAYFRAYEGVNSGGLVGAFRVRAVRALGADATLIQNIPGGRVAVPEVTHRVESALLYPVMRGRDVKRWHATASSLYLLTHDTEGREAFPVTRMRREFPHAYAYLKHFETQLLARRSAPVRQQMSDDRFYAILGYGPHTLATWKVVFKDLTEVFQACVVGPTDSTLPGKPVIADYTLRLIPLHTEEEAHYVAGLLNSTPSVLALYYSSTGVQTQRYHATDSEKLAIPPYESRPGQRRLAELSRSCHTAAQENDLSVLRDAEEALGNAAATFWSISSDELAEMRRLEAPLDTRAPSDADYPLGHSMVAEDEEDA